MKAILLSLFIFSIGAHASMSPYDSCIYNGSLVGDGKGYDNIGEFCIKLVKDAGQKVVKGDRSIYAHGNIIVVEEAGKRVVITGKSSRMSEVQSVAYDRENARVIVLDKSGELLSFDTTNSGNIAPRFFFSLTKGDMDRVTKIVPLAKFGSILLVFKQGDFAIFNLHATKFSPKKESATDVLKRFTREETKLTEVSAVEYDEEKHLLKIGDKSGTALFDLTNFPQFTRK